MVLFINLWLIHSWLTTIILSVSTFLIRDVHLTKTKLFTLVVNTGILFLLTFEVLPPWTVSMKNIRNILCHFCLINYCPSVIFCPFFIISVSCLLSYVICIRVSNSVSYVLSVIYFILSVIIYFCDHMCVGEYLSSHNIYIYLSSYNISSWSRFLILYFALSNS